MSLHFFAVPALDPGAAEEELNRFCAARRVVGLERQFVEAGLNSFWSFCVTVADGTGPLPDAVKAADRRSSSRVDYKSVLSENDFAIYAELRSWRKIEAERGGVPVYAVFTNEQLATIVQSRADTLASLGEIEGIGSARLARYGEALLARLRDLWRPKLE